MTAILLTGVNGVVGSPLKLRLESERYDVVSVTRNGQEASSDILHWDLEEGALESHVKNIKSKNIEVLIHCAPIWLLPAHLHTFSLAGIRRIVVFSSSSVIGKKSSKNESEQRLVRLLIDSEEEISQYCTDHDIACTIFRPSMIYGYNRDQNISKIAAFIKRFGLVFLAGSAKGMRQPVHADDLVQASLSVLNNVNCHGKTYFLSGAECLSYRAMVVKIFEGLQRRPRIIILPLLAIRMMLKLAALSGRFAYTPDMADRMNQDLKYDISPAQRDFGYAPQKFLTRPERDLP